MSISLRLVVRLAVLSALGVIAAPLTAQSAPPSHPIAHVTVDSSHRTVTVNIGPFTLPAMAMHMDEPMGGMNMGGMDEGMDMSNDTTTVIRFDWPVDAYGQGFHLEVNDANGHPLSRELLHHIIAINYDRRQLLYNATERLFGAGKETEDVTLPTTIGIPLSTGNRLGVYTMWNNTTGHEINGVWVKLVLHWVPSSWRTHPDAVLPFYADVDNDVGGDDTFDVPPGKSSKSYEFVMPISGHLIGVGGHLHDYGRSVELQDVETGDVIVKLTSTLDSKGRITAISRKIFVLKQPHLLAGHRYRVIGTYDSPRSDTIANGAMASILGLFKPDDPKEWPAIDPSNSVFQKDVHSLRVYVDDADPSAPVKTTFVTYKQ